MTMNGGKKNKNKNKNKMNMKNGKKRKKNVLPTDTQVPSARPSMSPTGVCPRFHPLIRRLMLQLLLAN